MGFSSLYINKRKFKIFVKEKTIIFLAISTDFKLFIHTYIIYITYIIYLAHETYITHITYKTHILKLIFEAYKKIFFIIFFLYIKMTNKYNRKHKEKTLK